MSKKKKISLISIAVFVVFVISASVISYSIATRESGSNNIESGLTNRGSSISDNMDYVTNIDMIIENSLEGESFNIVEILPAGVSSNGLSEYISSGKFKDYVIDENREGTDKMAADKISYSCVNVNSTTSLSDTSGGSTIQDVLDAADLIYVSSPNYASYTGNGNMSEEIYNWLHTYSLSTYRPIIMDYTTKSISDADDPSKPSTYKSFVNAVSSNYIKYRTFFWNNASSAQEFFNAKNDSYYLKYNVNLNKATGNVLVVSNNGGNEAIQTMFSGYANITSDAYVGRDSNKPNKMTYEVVSTAALTADKLSGYDFVILEDSIMSSQVPSDIYAALKTLSETSKYIIYDKKHLESGSTDGSDNDVSGNNYIKLMDLLISNKGVSRYTNVLPVSYGFFSSLNAAGEDGKATAKNIADLINYSDYRGSLTSGANGKVFRVLELQPCYPIDPDLAQSQTGMRGQITGAIGFKGNYYKNPSQVLSGVSEDQVDENTEYYKFELSKAKIVKATGLKYSQIQIDQMSTDEFISDKDVVLETYDLVYVGGNTTALTPYTMKSFYAGNYGALSAYRTYAITKYLSTFDMFSHTGNISQLFSYSSNTSSNAGASYGTIEGANVTNVVLNGNDITLNKYNELKAYIDAGMPIIFSDRVSSAYDQIKDLSRLEQLSRHDIDPDSRMYKLLNYADGKRKDTVSILWDLDISNYQGEDDYNLNEDNVYGNALTDYVTLFTEDANQKIAAAIGQSTTRPSLKIVNKPKDYIQGSTNSYNKNEDGSMTITASVTPSTASKNHNFTLKLLIDDDGNGTFDEAEELVASTNYTYVEDSDATASLTYTFKYDDFFGLVSWKVIAEDASNSTGACDIATGYAYYERNEDVDKKEVNVLQIMPVARVDNPSDNYGQSDGHSLYLCYECQMAKYRAKYNITTNGDVYTNTSGVFETHQGVTMGLHEHKFGITQFDTAGQKTSGSDNYGSEDWDANLADILANDYQFSTDILFLDELNEYTQIINGNSATNADGDEVLTTTTVDENGNAFGTDADGNPITMTWVDYYTAKADDYYSKWEEAKAKLEASGTETKLISYLQKLKATAPIVVSPGGQSITLSANTIQEWIDHKAFYRYFFYYGYYISEYNALYKNWITYNNPVVENHTLYNKYNCLSNTSDTWLYNCYDVVVLGYAEDFGGNDLTLQECADIKKYVANGGTILTTHDSTTRYAKSGAVNLTTELRSTFGMDRFHVTGTEDEKLSGSFSVTDSNAKELVIKDSSTGKFFGPVYLTNQNVTVDIVLDTTGKDFAQTAYSPDEYIYEFYKVTYGDTVTSGSNFNVTFNVYDTEADAIAGNKRNTNFSYQINRFDPWSWGYVADGTISNGTITYNGINLETVSINDTLKYRKYTTADADLYYFTELSTIGSDSLNKRVLWQKKMSDLAVGNGGTYFGVISPVGTTDAVGIFETTSNNSSPYTYVEYNMQDAISWNKDILQSANSGTNRASQVNKGIVTTYPFTISSELRISGTHTQTYALDMEDSGIAVWYTLAACDGSKSRSSLFAASPYDGMDNYFLYSYHNGKGTVNYCGAGHTVVTGPNRDNNDERMLYINIIVNAVRNKGSKPKITVHEKGKPDETIKYSEEIKTNPVVDETGTNYTYNVNSKEDIPEFDYKIKVNSQTTLAEAYVFYDLNYGIDSGDYSNKYTKDDNHVLIYHYLPGTEADDVKANFIKRNGAQTIIGMLREKLYLDSVSGDDLMKLKPSYFDPYGSFTYIVIWAKDANGKTSYQRIKINLVPYLFDLTDANFDYNHQYMTTMSFNLDITDRNKFNI